MSELDEAMAVLMDAKPSPEAVRKLAADTIHKRDNPHTLESVFTPPVNSNPIPRYLTCLLCGIQINNEIIYMGRPPADMAKHPASVHVAFHNQIHQLTNPDA
ncbi:hypothetical protein FQP90_13690 [Paenarthrobacter nitroguajacolicus]|uniref:Uncharacterized protein n=1 Tax=Paenarthrobacter nitroguajacolicus TaxID=211146 RepID=A0A558GXI0_PAENT|nr:hypothetical protein [Paenarthrobacter nitroguajacolicus]TVU61588.1 hypothetical protein FQP90_13690 [Paenarthrobacter nitroguajacolicus]